MSYLRRFFLKRILSPEYGFCDLKRMIKAKNHSGDSSPKTMRTIWLELRRILDIEESYTAKPKSKLHLLKFLPKSQEELELKSMKDSFDTAIIPLSSDNELLDKYVSYLGHVRIGRLMEDVDMFAGDIRLSGHVCWVGKSSMEVMVWLDQSEGGEWKRITKALLLMAARNSLNTGPAIVNPLKTQTKEEEEILHEAEKRKEWRQKGRLNMVLKKVPSEEELNLVHSLFIKTMASSDETIAGGRILPPNSKWMTDAAIHNLIFCHPEFRNLHNKIFGGFLMRQALELAWLTAYLYGSKTPRLVKISDVSFFKPVDVGSLLKLHSSITYTEGEYLQIFVFAEVLGAPDLKGVSTTSFDFTYHFGKDCDAIYPLTYLDAMNYINGRRQFYDDTELLTLGERDKEPKS